MIARSPARSRALGLALGHLADGLLGDPATWHPVAGFGRTAAALERVTWADSRARGLLHTTALVGSVAALGVAAERATRPRPLLHTAATAVATWVVLGGTSLGREAAHVGAQLARDDLSAARRRLTRLVGRDTTNLDVTEVSRAVVESVAENTSDAVVAPLLLGAVAGVPGLLGYRAANTLDAMVGHRGERYGRFGWAAARLDDLLNLPGSRIAALLAAATASTVGGEPRAALAAWRRDARRHPSPNAGVVEAAFAGALGLRLGGTNTYGHGVEERVRLGDGRAPRPDDIARARALARRVGFGAAVVSVSLAVASSARPSWPRSPDR